MIKENRYQNTYQKKYIHSQSTDP